MGLGKLRRQDIPGFPTNWQGAGDWSCGNSGQHSRWRGLWRSQLRMTSPLLLPAAQPSPGSRASPPALPLSQIPGGRMHGLPFGMPCALFFSEHAGT